ASYSFGSHPDSGAMKKCRKNTTAAKILVRVCARIPLPVEQARTVALRGHDDNMTTSLPLLAAPEVPLAHLDDLWFQVSGTLCNLTCAHCFISCSPHNRSFGFLDLAAVRRH